MESLMQHLMENLLIPDSWIYLIVKVGALLLVLFVWMLIMAHPAY
ncbi:hypothetical protein NIES4101_52450 [Calothrix sp. NIES-4101]|nr:hypothetical protein NIES4101_52450 [Calothrix sp. NIES-4101]